MAVLPLHDAVHVSLAQLLQRWNAGWDWALLSYFCCAVRHFGLFSS